MKTFLVALFSLFSIACLRAESAPSPYAADLIPAALKENAHAVLRKDIRKLEVVKGGRATMTVHRVITILDKQGLPNAALVLFYDKFNKLGDIYGTFYDRNGKVVEKLKNKDIQDVSLTGSSLASDDRGKYIQPTSSSSGYPFTVEYQYTVFYRGLLSFPAWVPQNRENLSVESAELIVSVPDKNLLAYNSENLDQTVNIRSSGGDYLFEWKVENRPVFKKEQMGPSSLDLVPVVYLAPKQINIDGYTGWTSSWESYGEFFYQLNEGRQTLPSELQLKVDQLTAGLPDPLEKAKVLYAYMQENTRYVSIQLGIGGWQTYDADYVFRNGYGDCKALTNYMQSMLGYLDIPAYTTLVKAGERIPDIKIDFPSNQFNHVILCIPHAGDTTWLECTSSTNPFGYLGDFTEDRHVLILTKEGGKLVKTPGSTAEMNQQIRQTEVQLSTGGEAKVSVHTEASGFQQDRLRFYAEEASIREREKYLRSRIDAGSFELGTFSFAEKTAATVPTYMIDYALVAPHWAKASGPRLFISPNVLERATFVPEKMTERTQPVQLKFSYQDIDTVLYHLPTGYSIESMDDQVIEIETIFGHYKAQVEMLDPETLRYTRQLKMEKIQLPPSYYEELREFFLQINQADNMQVVLSNRS